MNHKVIERYGKIVKEARTNRHEVTIFDSTGPAIQDIAMPNIIYRKATYSEKQQNTEKPGT